MIKYLKKVSIMILMLVLVLGAKTGVTANASIEGTITGQDVVDDSNAEEWRIYNDTDSNIVYTGSWKEEVDAASGDDYHVTDQRNVGDTIKFAFYGTKLKIKVGSESEASVANIKIDGKDYGNVMKYIEGGCKKFFSVSNLPEAEHNVVITTVKNINTSLNNYESSVFALDEVKIDATGELRPYVDHRANLTLYMNNGAENKYDLTVDELNEFLTWYDEASKGTAQTYYVFHKEVVEGSLSNDDYIPYNKIEYFNIQKYDVKLK